MKWPGRPPIAITVPATGAPNSAKIISGPCRLKGWSLRGLEAAGLEGTGAVVAPAAGATLASVTINQPGTYVISWQVELGAGAAAADQNNVALFVGAAQVATSDNLGAAGNYPQDPVQENVAGGGVVVALKAIGAGTAAVTYDVQLSAGGNLSAEATITDNAQNLAVVGVPAGLSETRWLDGDGIYVSSQLAVSVGSGGLFGVLYVGEYRDDQ